MDLVWLVYGISLLRGFGGMLAATVLITIGIMCFLLMYRAVEGSQEDYYRDKELTIRAEKAKWAMGHVKTAFVVFIISSTLLTLLPSEKTAYMMVGAYATQKIVENDKVQETGSKVMKIINQKLDSYVVDGIAEAEKTVKGKNK